MATDKKPYRIRRRFTDEFKAGAVRLVIDEGKSVGQAARELDLTESALRMWVERARAGRAPGGGHVPTGSRSPSGETSPGVNRPISETFMKRPAESRHTLPEAERPGPAH